MPCMEVSDLRTLWRQGKGTINNRPRANMQVYTVNEREYACEFNRRSEKWYFAYYWQILSFSYRSAVYAIVLLIKKKRELLDHPIYGE